MEHYRQQPRQQVQLVLRLHNASELSEHVLTKKVNTERLKNTVRVIAAAIRTLVGDWKMQMPARRYDEPTVKMKRAM